MKAGELQREASERMYLKHRNVPLSPYCIYVYLYVCVSNSKAETMRSDDSEDSLTEGAPVIRDDESIILRNIL